MRIFQLFGRPTFLKQFHGWLTLIWGALIPVTVLTGLKGSIVWIALMSVWANFASHFAAWQSSRTEVQLADDTDDTDALAVRAVQPDRGTA